jgi:hypothetical protein
VLPAPPPVIAPPPTANGTAAPTGTANGSMVNSTDKQPAPVWPGANPPTTSAQYGEWARQQRPQGTVYGGVAPSQDRVPPGSNGAASLEPSSGSLTGHILSQGRPLDVAGERSSGSRVVVIAMVAVCVLVLLGLGVVVAHLAHMF